MKRALTGKAKRSFVIFAAAVTTAVAGFSVGVVSAANTQSEKYAVPAGGTVYDNSYAVSYRITCNNGNQRTLINS